MRTIWLASYPKSGNTWLRMLVANLSAVDKPVDINDLPERGGIASARAPFDHLTLLDSGLLTHEEIDLIRPRVYEELARGEDDDEYDKTPEAQPVRFVKTHDAYTYTTTGEPLMAGARGAHGVILIVRDPRDVAPSLANHMQASIDSVIAFMNSFKAQFCGGHYRQYTQLRQTPLSWSGFAASWLEQPDIPVHLVRYEDLHADTAGVFSRALAFAGYPARREQIERAVSFARFSTLKSQEEERGFRETPTHAESFFRRGETGAWREELTAEQAARIEAAHGDLMRRLGYGLSTDEMGAVA